jgi:hypothetical protein
MENENALVVHETALPALDQETVDVIVKDAEAGRLFAKPTDTAEFKIGDEMVPRLVGRVLEVDRYAGKWDAGEMDKLRNFENPEDLPDGYDLRADVTILTPDFLTVTISLPPSSYKFHFANQVKRLTRAGLSITDMLCEFTVKTVKGKAGIFPVVVTKVMEATPKSATAKPVNSLSPKADVVAEALERDITDDDIPF